MTGSTKAAVWCAIGSLVVLTGYSAAVGADARLWFGWTVLAVLAIGSALTRRG